jgi:hypothetical protein
MFDLDQHVRSWRHLASGTLGDSKELLDELEAHLREEFDRLTASGQAAEDAWEAATRKLGSPQKLAGEFSKLRNRYWVPAWIATGLLTIACLGGFAFVRFSTRGFSPLLAVHVVLVTAGYGAVFAVGLLGVCAVLIRAVSGWGDRQNAALSTTGARLALIAVVTTFLGVVLGAWWSHDNLGRWWGWDPKEIGGACVLAWACVLLQCFRSRNSTPLMPMSMAVMGNMVVALAWFGPVFLGGLHSYAYVNSIAGMILGGFLIAQIALVYLMLLPAGVVRLRRFRAPGE